MSTHQVDITSTVPREVRAELADTIEEIGQAMGLLREAITDTEAGSVESAVLCGDDALEILSGLESKFSELAAKVAGWTSRRQHP